MFKLRIVHKGLAFLLIPLALQVAFGVALYHLAKETELLARREATRTKTIELINDVIIQTACGWSSIGSHIMREDQTGLEPEEYKKRLEATLTEASDAWGELPQQRQVITRSEKLVADQYKLLKALRKESDTPNSVVPLFVKYVPEMTRIGGELTRLSSLMNCERSVLENLRQEAVTKRKQLEQLVFFAVAADIMLTIILLLFFLGDITSRLKILVGNAQRLPRDEELQQELGGTDELAYLDTVLHEASKELKEAREQRKSLMQMVAHDLRGPLTSTKFTLDQLSNDKPKDPAELTEQLGGAKHNLNLSLSLLEDLLTVERLEAGKLEIHRDLIDIKSIVEDSFDGVSNLAKNKSLSLVDETDSVVLELDRLRVLQVLNNLISNAIKHSPNGATVKISSRIEPKFVKLSVSDEGAGIASEKQELLFRKFSRLDDAVKEGTGLGLAITKLIVTAHNGTVGVDSTPGQGSTFWFTLPTPVDLTKVENL